MCVDERDEGNPESDLPEKKDDGKNGEKVRQFGKKRPSDEEFFEKKTT